LSTAKAGYLTRKLFDVSQDVIIKEDDCGTKEGVLVSCITSSGMEVAVEKISKGRFLAEDLKDKEGNVLFKKNHLITRDDTAKIEASGGEKSLTYGKTEHWVRSVDMVLDDGSVHTFTKLSRTELEDIKKQNTRAGEIYRAMDALLATHTDALAAAKPQVSKDSTGYALWNVHDVANDTFDLTRVITGSQGTLGLITNITFGLIQPKPHAQMLVIFLRPKHMAQLGSIVNTVLQYKPESFESYDDRTFLVLLKVLPSMLKRLGASIFSLGWKFLPEQQWTLVNSCWTPPMK
jgi:hypothetical protein